MVAMNHQRLARLMAGRNRTALIAVAIVGAVLMLVSTITSLPDNEIHVTSFTPSGHVDLKTNFTVKFSKQMVSKDSLDLPVTDPPIVFSPPIPGLARWIDVDMLRFFPDTTLLAATAYTARAQSDKTWISGFKIVDKSTFKFSTPGLTASVPRYSIVPDDKTPEMARLKIALSFNYPVKAEDLNKRLKIKGENGASASSLDYIVQVPELLGQSLSDSAAAAPVPDDTWLTSYIITSAPFELSTNQQTYRLTISKDLGCKNCGMTMSVEFSYVLVVRPQRNFVINSVEPLTQTDGGVIYIYFSDRISADQVKPYIKLDPDTNFTVEEQYSAVLLRGSFHPSQVFTLTVGRGCPSAEGQPLQREFSSRIVFPDLPPSISFSSQGTFLPRLGNGLLEFKTTNVSKLTVEVEQIFPNNLVYFLTSGYADVNNYYRPQSIQLGRTFFVKDVDQETPPNVPTATTVDLKTLVGDSVQGVYRIAVRDRSQRWVSDTRFAMLTDIGITARLSGDYLMVWANSLASTEPISGASITLLSRSNQTLLEGKTDSHGIATFENVKDKLTGFDPFVIVATKGKDMSYVRLDQSMLPLSDFDVAGRPYLASGYEAFVYQDRGVYRPGDTVHLVSLVRGVKASTPPSFPYSITVYDPTGSKFTSFRLSTDGSAMETVDLAIPDFAGTGKYTAVAEIGDEIQIGRTAFQVEDFIPNRIKVSLTVPSVSYDSGDTLRASVDSKYLFGPPAANHKVAGHLTIEPMVFAPKGWSSYDFNDDNKSFTRMEADFPDARLDDTGGYVYTYAIPAKLVAPSTLKGLISATVSEDGGRAVSAYSEVVIHPYKKYLGLKIGLDGYARKGEPVTTQIVSVDQSGTAVASDSVKVKFYRVVYNTLYKTDASGFGHFVSEKRLQIRDSSYVTVPITGASVTFTPNEYGQYEIVASEPGNGHSASVRFYASGWGFSPWAMTNPDKIELKLDKDSYVAGDKAILQVQAPFGGKLLVTIEKDKVYKTITRDMKENTAEIELPVKEEYFPNAYITASVIRGANDLEPNMPARAFGLVPLKLQTDNKRLGITLTAPEVVKPKSVVHIDLQVNKAKVTQVTLAAVDAGILQLTDFTTPDPMEFFYGKKQPILKPYDMYSVLYSHVNQAENQIRPGGGQMFAAARKRHLNPISARRVKPVALWSGLIRTDSSGKATVSFTLPEFNGKLVLMAVATQNDLFGSATGEITVRDKIVIQESFPRFVSPNDVFDGRVTLFNNTGSQADIHVTLHGNGPVEILLTRHRHYSASPTERKGSALFSMQSGAGPRKDYVHCRCRSIRRKIIPLD